MQYRIDLNCDLGEGMANDSLIMPYLSSCNIACGGHFGNRETIVEALLLAKSNGVKVGAHPSFPDRENFGRKVLSMEANALSASIQEQVELFLRTCDEFGIKMNHVKLHGALYNCAAKDRAIADVVLKALNEMNTDFQLYAPYGSILAEKATTDFHVVHEAFIDRRYNADLSLVDRSEENALISNVNDAWEQLSSIVKTQNVKTINGELVHLEAETFCIHGDNLNVMEMLTGIHERLSSTNNSFQ